MIDGKLARVTAFSKQQGFGRVVVADEGELAFDMSVAPVVRVGVVDVLERLMHAEIELFLGESSQGANKRNGYVDRRFGIKGIGEIRVRVPRDRAGQFESKVVPAGRRYDGAIEKDLALLHLAELRTRMQSHVSRRVLGLQVSAQELSNALHTIVPTAWIVLYVPKWRPMRWARAKHGFRVSCWPLAVARVTRWPTTVWCRSRSGCFEKR